MACIGVGVTVDNTPYRRWEELIDARGRGRRVRDCFCSEYHAEVVAHRVGEPFGTLILALAVTVIETALIVSVTIAAPAEKAD